MTARVLVTDAVRSKWRSNKSAATVMDISGAYLGDVLAGRRRVTASFAQALELTLARPGLAKEILYAQVNDDLESLD